MGGALYVNVGCGLVAPSDWINLDGSYSAVLAKSTVLQPLGNWLRGRSGTMAQEWPANIRIWDVRRGLPFRDETVAAVYASHFLEHLNRKDATDFVVECYRALIPEGRVRFVVPDLLKLSTKYIDAKRNGAKSEATDKFLEALACWPIRDSSMWPVRLVRMWKQFNVHKWFYDADSLALLLEQAGFADAREAKYLDSAIQNICSVEREDRFVDSICIEAVKRC